MKSKQAYLITEAKQEREETGDYSAGWANQNRFSGCHIR